MSRRVGVLGLGNWGTALANHLANKGFKVVGWTKDAAVAESVTAAHRNPRYLSHVALSPNLSGTTDPSHALSSEFVVLAFPSKALAEMVPLLKAPEGSIYVSAIKGFEFSTNLTPLHYIRETLGSAPRLCVLSGPSFAKDVVIGSPAGVVAASDDEATARSVADLFSNDRLKVYISTDVMGVELGGILKNVIAVAAGVSDGLGFGDSARAGLITRGLAEMMRLTTAMGGDVRTLSGLSGLGDLVMTSTCDASRNRTVGIRLGKGESLDTIIATLGSVAEGVRTTPIVLQLAEKYGVEMPITAEVAKLINGEATAEEMVRSLISRPLKKEF